MQMQKIQEINVSKKKILRKTDAAPADMTIVSLDYVAASVPGKTRVRQRPVGTYLKMFFY